MFLINLKLYVCVEPKHMSSDAKRRYTSKNIKVSLRNTLGIYNLLGITDTLLESLYCPGKVSRPLGLQNTRCRKCILNCMSRWFVEARWLLFALQDPSSKIWDLTKFENIRTVLYLSEDIIQCPLSLLGIKLL